jgi:hypothetical protein
MSEFGTDKVRSPWKRINRKVEIMKTTILNTPLSHAATGEIPECRAKRLTSSFRRQPAGEAGVFVIYNAPPCPRLALYFNRAILPVGATYCKTGRERRTGKPETPGSNADAKASGARASLDRRINGTGEAGVKPGRGVC